MLLAYCHQVHPPNKIIFGFKVSKNNSFGFVFLHSKIIRKGSKVLGFSGTCLSKIWVKSICNIVAKLGKRKCLQKDNQHLR